MTFVQATPPDISTADAQRIALERFGIEASARSLGSHQDRNFLLTTAGERLLLKIANPDTSATDLLAQSLAAEHLRSRGLRAPGTRPGLDGELVQPVELGGQRLHARLLDFLEGEPLSVRGYLSPRRLRAMGELAARASIALADLEVVERVHQWEARRSPAVLDGLLPFVADEPLRERLQSATAEAWASIDAGALPLQAVHGDLTDDNVLETGEGIPDTIIDLGDLNLSWAVSELAVTVSSLLHHPGGGISSALRAVEAFHAIRPLSSAEARALWPLVVARGAVLVASSHHVLATDPGNTYAAENAPHELAIFERATEVPLPVATELVLRATGRPSESPVLPAFVPLLPSLAPADIAVLDLSATSPALHEGRWRRPDAEAEVIAQALTTRRATMTRYREPRLTRARVDSASEPVSTALGIELAFAEPVEVVAPWDGVVSGSVLDGAGVRLTLGRIALAEGPVAAGDVLGAATRLTVRVGDVPEFTTASLAPGWDAIAIDPTPLVFGRALAPRPSNADLVARRASSLASAQEHYYDAPPVMVRGWQHHLVDEISRVYLDIVNNVTSIGHAHPRLVEAIAEQSRLLNTNSRFNYPAIVEFSERLGALLPAALDSVFLVNSGTEAVDLALRIARAWSGRRDVVAVREAYHGWSDLADAVSTSIADNPGALETRPDWVHTVDAPNSYRGRYRGAESARYSGDAVAAIERLVAEGRPPGAFIAETFYGNAGGIALPDGYLSAIYAAVRGAGGLCVADEVQVGYGRLGDWFWGFEQQGVVPDIVAVAKAMGNGHPLGAVITTREIAEHYRTQGYFFSSAGGSPVSSVVGTTVLDVIRDERLQQNARDTGGYLKAQLERLGERHPLIGAVHGSGFYLGLEFVRDRETLEPATEETAAICERLLQLGVIVQPTSDRQCVLKIKPPMCLTRESADFFVAALDEVLTTGW